MTPLVLAVVGPTVGAVLSIILWLTKRNIEDMTSTLTKVNDNVVALSVEIPKTYVTKDELLIHIRSEEQQHRHANEQLLEIRAELKELRSWHHT
jgi:sRNA-binding carbon storage regulator CsrA